MQLVQYSVVIPVFNSQNTLEELFLRIKKIFEYSGNSFEIIFVEDCGRDTSWLVIEQLKSKYPSFIRGIKLSKNFGQHNATMCGFRFALGEYIITIDDDLQTPPEEIPLLISRQQESAAEAVYGIYSEKKHNRFRNVGSAFVQKTFRSVFHSRGNISSFRLISKSLCKRIIAHRQNFVFIDGLIHWSTKYIEHVHVHHEKRAQGNSNYTVMKLLKLSGNLFFNFTTLPLRLVVYFGAFSALVSFIIGIIFIVRKLIYDVPLGYTSIIVSIFFSTGIVLLVFGILGEYISRIYTVQNEKPQYSIKEEI